MTSFGRRLGRLVLRRTVLLLSRLSSHLGDQLLAAEAWRTAVLAAFRHDLPRAAPPVDLRFDAKLPLNEGGRFDWSPTRATISLNAVRADVGLSLLHELGHYLDIKVLGDGELPASVADPRLQSWRRVVSRSAAVRSLTNEHDTLIHAAHPHATHLVYLLDFWELFARSYAQWIAERSNDSSLARQLAETFQLQYPDQWEYRDFRAISAEFDRLAKEFKWN